MKLQEVISLPIEIGDTLLMGKFKNKKTIVKTIGWDEKGQLIINGKTVIRKKSVVTIVPNRLNPRAFLNRLVVDYTVLII